MDFLFIWSSSYRIKTLQLVRTRSSLGVIAFFVPFFASFLLFSYGRRCFPSFHRFIAHIYCFSLFAIPYGRKERHRFCTYFFRVQNWLFKSRIPPLVFASFRHFQDLYSDPKGHLLFKSRFPPSFTKPIRIPPFDSEPIPIPPRYFHPVSRPQYFSSRIPPNLCWTHMFIPNLHQGRNSPAPGNLKRRGYNL